MLRASSAEIEQLLRQELAENPALELVHGEEFRLSWRAQTSFRGAASFAGENSPDDPLDSLAERRTVLAQLEEQLSLLLAPADYEASLEILHNLDDRGYLREPPERLALQPGLSGDRLERILRAFHELTPPGIGARDLRECLLIQCQHLAEGDPRDDKVCSLARRMLADAWEEYTAQQFKRAARKLGVTPGEVEAAAAWISRSLYPYPLRLVPDEAVDAQHLLSPDLIIHALPLSDRKMYVLEIPGEEALKLRLSRAFERLLQTRQRAPAQCSREEWEWVEAQAERSREFIASLQQRWVTLRRIAEYVIAYQSAFLEHGPRCLRPITRAEVARTLEIHESTVSRAVSEKSVQLPNGRIIPFSDLFKAALPVQEVMREVLENATGPLSDREIVEQLKARGLALARRTVAKYRGQMHIPNRFERA